MKSEFAVDEAFGNVRHETEWQERSNCRGVQPELFFETKADLVDEAKKICNTCPVREECLSEEVSGLERGKLTISDVVGVRGGYSDKERKKVYSKSKSTFAKKKKASPASRPKGYKKTKPEKVTEKQPTSLTRISEEDQMKLDLLENEEVSLGSGAVLVRD